MNGRLESKIKIEQRTLESIKNSGYNLTSFFNSLAAKYEASSKETYITYIINFLKAMNKPVSEITSDEINNYFIDLTYKTNKKGEITETSGTYRATVHSAIHKYFTYLYDTNHISDKASTTIHAYVSNVAMFMNRTNKTPAELTLEDYDEMLASIKNCTSSYQITMYTSLKEFSHYLKAAKLNDDDPMQYKKRPKFKESKETH